MREALGFGTTFQTQDLPSASDSSSVVVTTSASVQTLQSFSTAVLLCSRKREKAELWADDLKKQKCTWILDSRCSINFSPIPSVSAFCASCVLLFNICSQILNELSAWG